MADRERLSAVGNLIEDLELWGEELRGILVSGCSTSFSGHLGGGFGPRIPKGVRFSQLWMKRLTRAIDDIDSGRREYIQLRFVGCPSDSDPKPLKNKEISHIKGVSVSTVEYNLRKAYDEILKMRKKYYTWSPKMLDFLNAKC